MEEAVPRDRRDPVREREVWAARGPRPCPEERAVARHSSNTDGRALGALTPWGAHTTCTPSWRPLRTTPPGLLSALTTKAQPHLHRVARVKERGQWGWAVTPPPACTGRREQTQPAVHQSAHGPHFQASTCTRGKPTRVHKKLVHKCPQQRGNGQHVEVTECPAGEPTN